MEKEHAAWIEVLKKSPIALVPEKANEQHYEVLQGSLSLYLERGLSIALDYGQRECLLWTSLNLLC